MGAMEGNTTDGSSTIGNGGFDIDRHRGELISNYHNDDGESGI